MLGKRWLPKDVAGKVPQDLCVMVKAGLLEAYSQSVRATPTGKRLEPVLLCALA
jgi:hypothetical protein